MTSGRAIMFALSTLTFAAGVAWEAPAGPNSPRAKLAGWLRDHGYANAATFVEPPNVNALPGVPANSGLPPDIIPPLP
jgi:hypothetical protein